MKLTESQLRQVIKETIEEALFGLSATNFGKNGHWRTSSKSQNPVIQTAYKLGWELSKPDEENIEGQYNAEIMSGMNNYVKPDDADWVEQSKYPKASWPMLIAKLNQAFRGQGLQVRGSNYHEEYEDMNGNVVDEPGVKRVLGTITVSR